MTATIASVRRGQTLSRYFHGKTFHPFLPTEVSFQTSWNQSSQPTAELPIKWANLFVVLKLVLYFLQSQTIFFLVHALLPTKGSFSRNSVSTSHYIKKAEHSQPKEHCHFIFLLFIFLKTTCTCSHGTKFAKVPVVSKAIQWIRIVMLRYTSAYIKPVPSECGSREQIY